MVLVMVAMLMASALTRRHNGKESLDHLVAVLIVLVVFSMLMVLVVFVVQRNGRWRPISWRDTKSGWKRMTYRNYLQR